jgi:hypothetical protein
MAPPAISAGELVVLSGIALKFLEAWFFTCGEVEASGESTTVVTGELVVLSGIPPGELLCVLTGG